MNYNLSDEQLIFETKKLLETTDIKALKSSLREMYIEWVQSPVADDVTERIEKTQSFKILLEFCKRLGLLIER